MKAKVRSVCSGIADVKGTKRKEMERKEKKRRREEKSDHSIQRSVCERYRQHTIEKKNLQKPSDDVKIAQRKSTDTNVNVNENETTG